MEDAFARSIGEVESHFDFDDGVSFFFRFSVFEGFWCWRFRSKAFDRKCQTRRRRRRMIMCVILIDDVMGSLFLSLFL